MNEWISINDKLPTNLQSVLLSTPNYVFEGFFSNLDGEIKFYSLGGFESYFVTHWMKLPDPPK